MKTKRQKSLRLSSVKEHSSQAGLTLLEVIISLSIIATATIGLNAIADRFSDDTKNTVTANQIRTFGEASKAYIKDNYVAVQGVATTTKPALIDVPTLIAAGHLTAGFLQTNAFGQSMCALVLEPSANRLQAMVVTEGGMTIDDLSMGSIASVIGGSGGAVYASDVSTIRGAMGGWSVPVATFNNRSNHLNRRCDGSAGNILLTAGHPTMALWFENGDTSSAFLSRNVVPGRPELNAMVTPLVMNSIQTPGSTCPTDGAIAQDGGGGIVSCQGGIWKTPGDGKCVSTASDLNFLQADGRCYNGENLPNSPAGSDWVFVEVYRHTNPANYYVAQRVVGMTGGTVGRVWQRNQQSGTQSGGWSAWVQQADPRVSIANGTVTSDKVISNNSGLIGGASQAMYDIGAGHIAAGNSIYSYGKICSQNSSGNCNGAGGTVIDGGNISASGSASVASTVSAGALVSTGTTYNVADTWAFQGLNSGWGGNASPQSAVGSAYVNDVYIRSIGKWASQLEKGSEEIGQFYLYINGYSSLYFGYGKLTGNTFSGNIQCTTDSKCGAGGFYWCGSSAHCAANNVFNNAHGFYGGAVAGVVNIPVNSVNKLW